MKQCPRCGSCYDDSPQFCSRCGSPLQFQQSAQNQPPYYGGQPCYDRDNAFDASGPEGKSRGVAGLLAIFLGGLGVQYFYLGKTGGGLLCMLLSAVTCGIWTIIMLIQGILMLCISNAEFERKYVQNPATMPLF